MHDDEFEETLTTDEADTLYSRSYYTGYGATAARWTPPEPEPEPIDMAWVNAEMAWQEKEMMRDMIDRPKAEEKLKRALGQAKGKARATTRRIDGLRRMLESTQNQIKEIERGL